MDRALILAATSNLLIIYILVITIFSHFISIQATSNKSQHLEKSTHIRFYFHDDLTGPNITTLQVVRPSSTSTPLTFGTVVVLDSLLTKGPEKSSKLVGRAQGFYVASSLEAPALSMVINLVFQEKKYNGSYLTVVGWNNQVVEVREMPVVGGSGLFRYAKGHVRITPYEFNPAAKNFVLEYNVYVTY